MSVAQRRIERNAWKRKGASPPVSTRAFQTHRTARAVPLQFAIAHTIPEGSRRAASIPFTACGRTQKRKGASPPVSTRVFKTHRTARAVPLQFAIANATPDGLRRAASIRNRKHETGRLAPCRFNTVHRMRQDSWKRKGASPPVSTCDFKTHRTARAVPLQFAIAHTIPDGSRRAASIPFTACGRAHGSGRAQALRSPRAFSKRTGRLAPCRFNTVHRLRQDSWKRKGASPPVSRRRPFC